VEIASRGVYHNGTFLGGFFLPLRSQAMRFAIACLALFTATTAFAEGTAAETSAKAGSFQCSVTDFGAKGDGKQLDTAAIQQAIDATASRGGGTVVLPGGEFLSKTLILKNNVTLHLTGGARLVATGNLNDYTQYGTFLRAENVENIGLTGPGLIDGRGAGLQGHRYVNLRFIRCKNVTLRDITMKDSPVWCAHFVECEGLKIEGIRIDSIDNPNTDGLDIDGCQKVYIANCRIRCGDDAIALKTNSTAPCKDIVVTNCTLATRCAAFRFGPEARGNFENIAVSNCVIHDTFGCGIKLQMNEGSQMKNICFDNLVMENVTGPISLRLANWIRGPIPREGNEKRPIGTFQNVMFSNIRARVAPAADTAMYRTSKFDPGPSQVGEDRSCISITGLPGHPIEGITMSNIHITFPGGGTAEDAARRDIPDLRDDYPEYNIFGVLPAYGLYAHHVKGLVLDNVRFDLATPDLRPAIVCDDLVGLDLANFTADSNPKAECLIRLEHARDAFIRGSRPRSPVGTFLRVEGDKSGDIGMAGNDLRHVERPFDLSDGTPKDAVEASANLGAK